MGRISIKKCKDCWESNYLWNKGLIRDSQDCNHSLRISNKFWRRTQEYKHFIWLRNYKPSKKEERAMMKAQQEKEENFEKLIKARLGI